MNVIETAKDNLAVLTLESKLLQNHIICLNGEITSEMANDFQNQIMYLTSLGSRVKNIQILLDSPGGNVYAGLSIIDMIKFAQNKGINVEIVCTGIAMSMAAVILMTGTRGKRAAMAHSTIMIHELSAWACGKITNIKNQVKEMERLHSVLTQLIVENSDIKEEEFINTDLYLDSSEALSKKIIDVIK